MSATDLAASLINGVPGARKLCAREFPLNWRGKTIPLNAVLLKGGKIASATPDSALVSSQLLDAACSLYRHVLPRLGKKFLRDLLQNPNMYTLILLRSAESVIDDCRRSVRNPEEYKKERAQLREQQRKLARQRHGDSESTLSASASELKISEPHDPQTSEADALAATMDEPNDSDTSSYTYDSDDVASDSDEEDSESESEEGSDGESAEDEDRRNAKTLKKWREDLENQCARYEDALLHSILKRSVTASSDVPSSTNSVGSSSSGENGNNVLTVRDIETDLEDNEYLRTVLAETDANGTRFVPIKNRLVCACSFEFLPTTEVGSYMQERGYSDLAAKTRILQVTLIGVRLKYQRLGLGHHLLRVCMDDTYVSPYDIALSYADETSVPFWRKHGFTDDTLLADRFRGLTDNWDQSVLMCHIAPRSQPIVYRSALENVVPTTVGQANVDTETLEVRPIAMSELMDQLRSRYVRTGKNDLRTDMQHFKTSMWEMYGQQMAFAEKWRSEIESLRDTVVKQDMLIEQLVRENQSLRGQLQTAAAKPSSTPSLRPANVGTECGQRRQPSFRSSSSSIGTIPVAEEPVEPATEDRKPKKATTSSVFSDSDVRSLDERYTYDRRLFALTVSVTPNSLEFSQLRQEFEEYFRSGKKRRPDLSTSHLSVVRVYGLDADVKSAQEKKFRECIASQPTSLGIRRVFLRAKKRTQMRSPRMEMSALEFCTELCDPDVLAVDTSGLAQVFLTMAVAPAGVGKSTSVLRPETKDAVMPMYRVVVRISKS